MLYAVLNENNKCIYVTNVTTGEENYISIGEDVKSTDYIGKIYDRENQKWYSTPQPTNEEIIEEIKKNQADIIDSYTLELIERGVI